MTMQAAGAAGGRGAYTGAGGHAFPLWTYPVPEPTPAAAAAGDPPRRTATSVSWGVNRGVGLDDARTGWLFQRRYDAYGKGRRATPPPRGTVDVAHSHVCRASVALAN